MLALGLLGCERAPASEICPRIEAGDLVFSELRGDQMDEDSIGHFIEIYNASDRTIDLQGVWLYHLATDGDERAIPIRTPLDLAPGGYVVIGPGPADDLPTWLDYGVGWDIPGGKPATGEYPINLVNTESYQVGSFELWSCDELIDELSYQLDTIPTLGTRSCGNLDSPPSADQNDDVTTGCWCTDAEPSEVPMPGVGLPGTPGRANRCP